VVEDIGSGHEPNVEVVGDDRQRAHRVPSHQTGRRFDGGVGPDRDRRHRHEISHRYANGLHVVSREAVLWAAGVPGPAFPARPDPAPGTARLAGAKARVGRAIAR
jgi:hypothetical protein